MRSYFAEKMKLSQCKAMQYCTGKWIPASAKVETKFLKSNMVAKLVGGQQGCVTSGPIGEWATEHIVTSAGFRYDAQACVKTPNGGVMRPDGFIPELNMFVEVKTRAYYSSGASWSEKLDHVARKYSKICDKDRPCIVVFVANQMYEKCGKALLDQEDPYVRDFVELGRKYGIQDWIPITDLRAYIMSR